MKWKHSIIAVGITALFIGLAFAPVTAIEDSKEEITIKYEYYTQDGNVVTGQIVATEKTLEEFFDQLFEIFEQIKTRADLNNVKELISATEFFKNNPKLGEILNDIIGTLFIHRALVLSRGRSFTLNPLKRSDLDLRNRISMWRYSGIPIINAKTYMLRPYRADFKILDGGQLGLMTRFVGIHIYIDKMFPRMSKTFFFGTPRFVWGMEMGLG